MNDQAEESKAFHSVCSAWMVSYACLRMRLAETEHGITNIAQLKQKRVRSKAYLSEESGGAPPESRGATRILAVLSDQQEKRLPDCWEALVQNRKM
jgi:hypothetical protein